MLCTWLTLFAPSVNSGTVTSAPLVVNDGAKIRLVATGTGKNFDLLYNTKELFPVWYETLDIELILLPFAVQTYITLKIILLVNLIMWFFSLILLIHDLFYSFSLYLHQLHTFLSSLLLVDIIQLLFP